ncbi:ABC transporter ATP-binding protein [Natrinema salifodinae]|uniref:ABC-2 type transport system ATP-binding protein n=1 Tax=Natrinema salifodinae TaxID=1202768 RepID=A0A1I0NAY2_9EURY|nr:ATP-binding cassette domain-containing protein [Natrinema salifodinae]SEV98465.1 ABC-2 type transport system ATP-binding protein [Natrinema salifodinae]
MDAIHVDGLTKEFDGVTAVDDLSFTVERGELFGLLGPNGAGKSTLINMLVALLPPSSGTASVNGHDVRSEKGAVRSSLGIVFQEPALDEELTGAENLAFHSRLYGQARSDRADRIDEVLGLVGLSAVRDDPVGTYSGGMKRRLEIARGLLHEPAVLFLDEPTVGLDARTRRDTWEYIEQLNEAAGVSIVLTTHYIEEADRLCDRVAIVDDGDIVAIDAPAALKESLGGDVVALEFASDGAEAGTEGQSDVPSALLDRLDDRAWCRDYAVADGRSGVHVTVDDGDARIAALVRLADETGAGITSIDLREPTLENVFLELTDRDRAAAGAGRSRGLAALGGTRSGSTATGTESRADVHDDRSSAVSTEDRS